MVDIDTKNKSEKESGNAEYAKFWSQPGLEEYDHKIFEGEKVTYKALMKNASFLRASALVYEMRHGETWETKIAREGLSNTAANKKLGEYGIDNIRWFEYNSGSTYANYRDLKNAKTDEQKVALLYMMHVYQHSKISLNGVINAFGMSAIDPLNALAFVTGGASVATNQALKISAQTTLKTVLMNGVKSHIATAHGKKLLAGAAAEGALGAGIQKHIEQKIETQEAKINNKVFQYKQDYDWSETASGTAAGAFIGTAFGVAGGAFVDTIKFGKFKWDNKSPTTPTTKPSPGPKTIAAPNGYVPLMPDKNTKTWWHYALKFDPFQRVKEAALWPTASRSVSAWRFVPNRYFTHTHTRRIIKYVDTAVEKSGIIDPFLKLDEKMIEFRLQKKAAVSDTQKDDIEKKIQETLEAFSNDPKNQESLTNLTDALTPLLKEINDYKAVGFKSESLGFDSLQTSALKEFVEDAQKLATAAKDPQTFLKYYQENRAIFDKAGKNVEGISGALQKYTTLAAGARLRMAAGDLTGVDPLHPTSRKLAQLNTTAADGSVKVYRSYERNIEDGDDGVLAGAKNSRFTASLENVRLLERSLNEGLYSKKIRTHSVFDSPNSGDNVENYAIRLNNFFERYKNDQNSLGKEATEKLAGLILEVYDSGRMGDALIALRRMRSRQGREGDQPRIPENLNTTLANLTGLAGNKFSEYNPEWEDAAKAIKQYTTIQQAFYHYHERDMNQIAEKFTRWIHDNNVAPGQGSLGAPGKVYFVNRPISMTWQHTLAALTGGRVVENPSANTGKQSGTDPYKIEWYWNNPAPEGATGVKALWHNITNRNSGITALFNPVTIPFRAAYGATKLVGAPILNHTAYGLTAAGIGAYGLTWGYEEITGDEIQIINPALKGTVKVADTLVVAPTRLALSGSELYINGIGKTLNFLSNDKIDLPKINLQNTWLDPDNIRLNSDWVDRIIPPANAADVNKTTSLTPAATNPGATMTNSNSNNTATSLAIPLPVISASPDDQQARQVILALGRGVSDLHSAAARDGWTDENKHKLAELQANHLAYAPKAKEFGGHAEDIVKKAGNVLSHTLEPNAKIDTRPPENTSPFQTQQEARLNETMKLLAAWQNGLVTLNNDIAKADTGTNGWTDERKKKLAALETSGKAFARDVFFLAPEQQKIFSDASNMQFLLLQAKESDQPVAASFISLLSAPKALPSTREAPSDKGHIKPPAVETAADDTAEKTDKKADLKEKKEKSANAETFNNGTGNGGASARTVSHGTDDGSFFGSVGGHAKDLANSFKRMTKVDDGDEITNAVSSTIGLFGAAGEKGAGFVGNTYDRLMAKQDRSGRSLIREVGAGILALVGMGSLFGPMLDRLGIGTIPIVGTLAKLATVVVVFMAARKGVDSVLPDVTPYAGQHVLQASSADRTRTHLPHLTQEEMNGGNVISMSNRGGPARVDTANSSNRGPDAMQTASGSNTHVSADASATGVHTGNVIHHPANLAGARDRAARADAVLHNQSGGNVVHVDFRQPAPAYTINGNTVQQLGNEL